jgi:hypothetical protein
MNQARELRSWRGLGLDALERLHPFHPEHLALGLVFTADREASKACAIGVRDVQAEDHDV